MKKIIFTFMLAVVSSVWTMSRAQDAKLPSLCDEWSLLVNYVLDGDDYYYSFKQYLTTDTVIGGLSYVKIEQQYGSYLGALREDDNRNIYFVHEGSDHEYLLYAFNAKVGDRLSNLWYGGRVKWCPNGYNATVIDISGDVFTVEVEYTYTNSGGEHFYPWPIYWVNGVGMVEGPVGHNCPGPECEGDYGQEVLCAYNNGEQVYISEAGQKYGCKYKGHEDIHITMTDTSSATKILRDGQLLIERGGKTYTAQGAEVK